MSLECIGGRCSAYDEVHIRCEPPARVRVVGDVEIPHRDDGHVFPMFQKVRFTVTIHCRGIAGWPFV
jgi:hypothetical protein